MFVVFARKRLGDHHLAEDVVQDSLIKALAADRHPETDEETTTWFYRILRRSIIDVYRKQRAQRRALERFKNELPETPGEEDERELCKCFRRLLPLVPAQYRELLDEVDLKGKEPDAPVFFGHAGGTSGYLRFVWHEPEHDITVAFCGSSLLVDVFHQRRQFEFECSWKRRCLT